MRDLQRRVRKKEANEGFRDKKNQRMARGGHGLSLVQRVGVGGEEGGPTQRVRKRSDAGGGYVKGVERKGPRKRIL